MLKNENDPEIVAIQKALDKIRQTKSGPTKIDNKNTDERSLPNITETKLKRRSLGDINASLPLTSAPKFSVVKLEDDDKSKISDAKETQQPGEEKEKDGDDNKDDEDVEYSKAGNNDYSELPESTAKDNQDETEDDLNMQIFNKISQVRRANTIIKAEITKSTRMIIVNLPVTKLEKENLVYIDFINHLSEGLMNVLYVQSHGDHLKVDL